jgi:S-ribosylhomocysteine lyase
MWCRTGMYVLFSWEPSGTEVMKIIQDMYQWIIDFPSNEPIPWATAAECGNYRDHNLSAAQEDAGKFLEIIREVKELWEYEYL